MGNSMANDLLVVAEKARHYVDELLVLGGGAPTSLVGRAADSIVRVVEHCLRALDKRHAPVGLDVLFCGSCAVAALASLLKSRLTDGSESWGHVTRAILHLDDALRAATTAEIDKSCTCSSRGKETA
jgi:hypothetical protein